MGQVIALCRHHLAVPEEAMEHFRNVMRALVAGEDMRGSKKRMWNMLSLYVEHVS